MSNLAVRVIFAVVAIPVVLFCMWGNDITRVALLSAMYAFGAFEWARMVSKMYKGPSMNVLAPLSALALTLSLVFQSGKFFGLSEVHGLVGLTLVVVVSFYVGLAYAKVDTEHLFAWFVLQLGAPLYLGLWGGFTVLLLGSGHGFEPALQFLLVLTSMWICDSAAYFVGKFLAGKGPFGRHPLAPSLSPKKTWEGSVGGTLFTVAWFLLWTTDLVYKIIDCNMLVAIIIALAMSIAGQAGDLLMSALKRWSKTKDSSHIFPGHGGVLDRVDSFLFAGPIVYLLLTFLQGLH